MEREVGDVPSIIREILVYIEVQLKLALIEGGFGQHAGTSHALDRNAAGWIRNSS
jgi:hypothetical protein